MSCVPEGPLEVVFSFNTTPSLYSCLDKLRDKFQEMIQRLQEDIPGIRIAVLVHGDYEGEPYVIQWVDFSSDIAKLCDFVNNVEPTKSGGGSKCYELVLREVRTKLSWTPNSRRALVLIGDKRPHEVFETCNEDKIDWRKETKALANNGVAIYAVQCRTNTGIFNMADFFYETISQVTKGKRLKLNIFGSLFHVLMAVCYREGNATTMLANYKKEVKARRGLYFEIKEIFDILQDKDSDADSSVSEDYGGSDDSGSSVSDSSSCSSLNKSESNTSKKSAVFKPTPGTTKSSLPRGNLRSTKQTKLDKFKQTNLPLLKRENVPENNFSLRSMMWTPWTVAFVPGKEHIPNARNNMWQKRPERPGYRFKSLPKRKMEGSRCLYEVSVQGPDKRSRRYTVFSCFSSHGVGTVQWENRLLRMSKCQLDRVLTLGCKVYIRYCPIGKRAEELLSVWEDLKRYDYAWKKVRNVRTGARDLMKGNVSISRADV